MSKTLVQKLASKIQAYHNCVQSKNTEWQARHESDIENLANELPRGAGINGKTSIDLERSNGKQYIVISSKFHYMDDDGYYAGWFYFDITIIANLDGYPDFNFAITSNDTDIDDDEINFLFGDYLVETFSYALTK